MDYDSSRYALLNRWDPRHLRTVERLLNPRPGQRVLEVGCGRGHLTRRLEEMGVDVTGVDANPQAAQVAVSPHVRHMRAEQLDFLDDSFDLVYSFHAIEHVPAIEQALAEMARVAKPAGHLLLVYPAEPIQGLYAVPASVILHGTPFRARRIHCQKLTPRRLRRLTDPLGLVHLHSEFNLLSSPQWVTLLQKAFYPPR